MFFTIVGNFNKLEGNRKRRIEAASSEERQMKRCCKATVAANDSNEDFTDAMPSTSTGKYILLQYMYVCMYYTRTRAQHKHLTFLCP